MVDNGDGCIGSIQAAEACSQKQEEQQDLQQAQKLSNKNVASAAGGAGLSAGHEEAVAIAEAVLTLRMALKYHISVMEAFNGMELGFAIKGGSKYRKKGKCGYADITFTRGGNTEVWEVKSAGVSGSGGADAQAVAAGEVQGYIKSYMAGNPAKTTSPGTSIPYIVTRPLGPGSISVYSPQGLNGGAADGAILYSSKSPTPVPTPVPVPVQAPNPSPVPPLLPIVPVGGEIGEILLGGLLLA